MKKIYLYNIDNQIIENVEKIHISNLDTIPNGSCSLVICDCLDSLRLDHRMIATHELFKKCAIGCEVILRFISLKLFSKHIYYDKIDMHSANNILAVCNSMLDETAFTELLNHHNNFQIKENTYTGLIRQIKLERIS